MTEEQQLEQLREAVNDTQFQLLTSNLKTKSGELVSSQIQPLDRSLAASIEIVKMRIANGPPFVVNILEGVKQL